MLEVNDTNFYQEVIKSSYHKPVLVQFWAPWCGPCHGLRATIEQIAEHKDFPVNFAALDVDQFTELALQYKVMGVPHTKIFVSGFPIDEFSDPLPANEITLFLENALLFPFILKYSHYTGEMDYDLFTDLEKRSPSSSRQDIYHLTLARYFFSRDLSKSISYLDKIPDFSFQFEDRIFIRDLYPLMELEYEPNALHKKLWAAKNALKRQDFESTYQFLLQANRIHSPDENEFPRMALFGFRRFLGIHHELNRKYKSQFSQILGSV